MAPTASTSAGHSASARISSELSKLWSSDPAVRIAASAALVAHLQAAAAAAAAGSDGSDNEEISYTLRRLIRGLASPRESSRLGFAVALTELLARFSSVIHIRQVLPVLLESSQLGHGLRGQEERDFLFSRLFGIHAVIASGLIFAASSSLHDWQVAIEETVYLGERKAWLRESAGWVVQLATRELLAKTTEQVAWREDGLKAVVRVLFINKPDPSSSSAPNEWTPEKLAMAVMLQETDVEADWATFTAPTFASPKLLSSAANIPAIARILKGMSANATSKKADEQAQSVFFGNGQLHYVWREVLQAYFPSSSVPATTSEKPKKKKSKIAEPASDKVPFLDFYTAAVEESLLGNSSATSGKYVGLVAFEACMAAAPCHIAPLLLTPNLLRTLMNHLSKGDRTLHGIANKVARSIPTACQKDPSIAFDVLIKLFNPPYGNTRFDAMTRTKTVEGVVASLDQDGIVRYAEWLVTFVLEADQAASAAEEGEQPDGMDLDGDDRDSGSRKVENKRSWAVDQLLLLVRKHSTPLPRTEDTVAVELPAWTLRILEFFALHGFFNLHKATKKGSIEALRSKPETPFTPATQTLFRSRFLSALTHLVTINPKCRGEPWTEIALSTLDTLSKEEKYLSLLGADEEAVAERQATAKLLSKLSKSKDQQRAKPMAFLMQVLLLLSYDPEDDIVENLEELRDAAEALFFTTKNGTAASGDAEDGEEAEPISVLIDLLVTLLQKPSTFVRTTAERVFTAFSGEVKEQALQLLLDQISPDSTVEVEEAAAAGSDDETEAAAAPNGKSAEDGSDNDSDDDEDSDSGDEDDEDLGIDLDADPELRAKVEAALRGVGMAVDEDEDDDDDEDEAEANGAEEEEEILDDDQMLELDDQLAEIFRAKKAQTKGNKADQEAALNSRLKVLDLLEGFAKAQPGNILVVDTVLPLLNVARRSSSEDKELAAKAGRVLRGIVQKPKEYPASTDVAALLPTLTAVHAAAQRASSPDALALASATSLYLCRIILGETGVRNSQEVIAVYQASLTDYLVRKQSRIQPKLFTDFIQRFKTASWALKDALLVASSEQTTTKDKHKRCQALHLVAELMTAHSSLKTDQAKAEVVAFAPAVASNVTAAFAAAVDGSTTQLNATRLKEVFKATMQAVRATRSCIPKGSESPVWTVWKVEELSAVLAQLAKSDKADKPASLNAASRQLLDAVLEGSGRQKVKDPANGLPPLMPKAVNGKQERKKAKQDQAAPAPVAPPAAKRKSAELHNETSSDSEDE